MSVFGVALIGASGARGCRHFQQSCFGWRCVGGAKTHHTSSVQIMPRVISALPEVSLCCTASLSFTQEHEGLPAKHFKQLASDKHVNPQLHHISAPRGSRGVQMKLVIRVKVYAKM